MPMLVWCKNFLKWQGYNFKTILNQDNISAQLLENNGMVSMGKRSRYINIRYFWIKDRVDGNEIKIEYLPTHIMLADYYTKPLQGSRFKVLREYIMGWRPMNELIITKIDEDESGN